MLGTKFQKAKAVTERLQGSRYRVSRPGREE